MDVRKAHQQGAIMTKTTDRFNRTLFGGGIPESGFTLVELLVASFVAALVSTVTWSILIETTKSDVRAESRRRLHENWNQATTLIQSEIALSDLIESEGLSPSDIEDDVDCDLLQDDNARLKLRMHLVGTLPDIVYGVRRISTLPEPHNNQYMGTPDAGVLIRCGPRLFIEDDGSSKYIQGKYQQSIVLDNLNLSKDDGLKINNPSNHKKLVEFSLSMHENQADANASTIRTKTLSSGGISRINEVPPIPSDVSICERICDSKDYYCGDNVTTLLKKNAREGPNYPTGKRGKISTEEDYTVGVDQAPVFGTDSICTNRPYIDGPNGAKITGSSGNYVINGNPTPGRANPPENAGVTLTGGTQGRNILLGTSANDTLNGGENHDALIGRDGNDLLNGDKGNDNILPWSSTSQESGDTTVYGGDGFDRIYLKNSAATYTLSSENPGIDCDNIYYKVESQTGNGILYLCSIEQIVFKESVRTMN